MWWIGAMLAWAGPADEAFDALAEGRNGRALQVLRAALDDDPDGAHRCLLGEVALQVGRTKEAQEVLEEVPDDALCAGRAAFIQAEALRREGDAAAAAERYEALTDSLLEPKTQPLARRLEAWAQRMLDEDPPNPGTAASLLAAALRLEADGSEKRLELARRLADLEPSGPARSLAVHELTAQVAAADGLAAADRRRLARLSGPQAALALLAPLPDDAATMATRVQVMPKGDPTARYTFAAALVEAHPDAEETLELRRELGLEMANGGWVTEARALLQPLASSDDEVGREVTWALTRLAIRAGDDDALEQLDAVLARYPAAAFRSEAEAMRQELVLDRLRTEARQGRFDPAGWDRVAVAAAPALEAAWATDDLEDRAQRLDALVAQWPWSPEAHQALLHRALSQPDGLEWLRARADQGPAAQALQDLSEPEIGIRTVKASGEAEVELLVRGLDELDMRLHRIDVEGWLRAGGSPDSLGELDVAIVAPDRTWTVSVPDGGLEVRFTTPVPVPGPGLYAVTAATADREARTLLLVSDARVLARAQGSDLAMVALRDGTPSTGSTRFWVRANDEVTSVRPDRDGLARTEIASAPAVVVAETPGGPAILQVGHGFSPMEDTVQTAVDLDRPVYRPGDTVRFRAVATKAGAPMQGDWRLSLTNPSGRVYQVIRARADRDGTVTGELVVPWTSTGRLAHGAGREDLTLRALPPGRDDEVQLATVRVIDDMPGTLRIELVPEDDQVHAVVFDGDGAPVADQPVLLTVDSGEEAVRRTDAAGRVTVDAPPDGLAWSVAAALPHDSGSHRSWLRPAPEAKPLGLRLDDPRSRPGEPVQLEVEGQGDAILRVVRLYPQRARPEPIDAPDPFEVPTLLVYDDDGSSTWRQGVRETVSTRTVSLDDGVVTVPGLDEGRYLLELVRPDGRASTRSATLEVRDGTHIRLDEAPLVGRSTPVAVDGAWTLLTAEGDRMLDAKVVPPGKTRSFDIDRRWHGHVMLVATALDDAHQRTVEVDAALEVELDAQRTGTRWAVSGRVTDAAGNPQRAQVVVRAVDELLIEELGRPPTLSEGLLTRRGGWPSQTARATALRHGGWAQALAAELLAEAAREEDARRRRLASEGRLSESKVAEVLDANVPLGVGGVGGGGSGYGRGGGNFGAKGEGGVGLVNGSPVILGGQGYTVYGTRSVGLWRVVTTDRDGRFSLDEVAPDPRRSWRVDTIAVVPGSVGTARQVVAASSDPWVAVDSLRPGWPDDVAEPRARVVNPSGDAVTVRLRAGDVDETHELPPHTTVEVALGELPVGTRRDVSLTVAGRVVAQIDAVFPLAEGEPGSGELRVAVPGEVGGTVVGAVALIDDRWVLDRPAHAISSGRAAVAALDALDGAEQAEALRRIRAGLAVARDRIGSLGARDGAQALRLVAEAADLLELPRHLVDEAAEQLVVEPSTPTERVEVAYARAVADVPVQEATVGRLLRDASFLDDEGRGMLARLLDRLNDRRLAELEPGMGVQWDLHAAERRRRIDSQAATKRPPPALGDPARADWIRTVALALDDTPGTGKRGVVRGFEAVAAPLSWSEAAPSGASAQRAHRWPAGLSGRPASVPSPAGRRQGEDDLSCGSEATSCRIRVGDAVAPRDHLDATGGLRASPTGRLLPATTRGRFTLWRATDDGHRAVHVEVVDDDVDLTPLGQGEVLAIAAQRRRIDAPFADVLAGRDSLEEWRPALRAQAADLRFAAADPDDAAGWIASFEDLRDEVPSSAIESDDVVHTARAYQRLGRSERAIQVYERAIGQVFLQEAAVVSEVGMMVGPLAGLQALREVTLRYPAVPVVRQSEFALPDRLLDMVGAIPEKAREQGVTDTELQLMAAAWDRRFVALASDSPLAPEAGLRLATGLTELGARDRALAWVQRLRKAHPDHELTDRWMLLEALLLTEQGRPERADGVLQQLSEGEVPLGGGRLGPSTLRDDARLALARLAEAEQRWKEAAERYEQVSSTFPEAYLASNALTRVQLRLDRRLVRGRLAERSKLRIWATNLDEVQVRAYAIDLRTLFLRDGGLPDPESVRIDGLRPAWSGTRPVGAGPFPEAQWLDLPLQGPGAWLVRLDADGASSVAWVLRSELEVHHNDQGAMRRLSVRLGDAPVAGAAVRAMGPSGIVAQTTDVRGVAMVGNGAGALVQSGPHVALTADVLPGGSVGASGAPMPEQPSLLDRVKGREKQRRMQRQDQYDYIGNEPAAAVEAQML